MSSTSQDIMQQAFATGGMEALRHIDPIVWDIEWDTHPTTHAELLAPVARVVPTVNPLLDAVLLSLGAEREGARTYSLRTGARASVRTLEAVFEALPHSCLYPTDYVEGRNPACYRGDAYRWNAASDVVRTLTETKAGEKVTWARWRELVSPYSRHATTGERYSRAMILVSNGPGKTYFRICTRSVSRTGGLLPYAEGPNCDVWRAHEIVEASSVVPDVALATIEALAAEHAPVTDQRYLSTLRSLLATGALAQMVPGSPGMTRLVLGAHVSPPPALAVIPAAAGTTTRSLVCPPDEAQAVLAWCAQQGVAHACDPMVEDVQAMLAATPTGTRPGLRPYQDQAVSVHLATKIGYANACSPGLGKTVMALAALRERAAGRHDFRALVVAPAAICAQWSAETAKFFPEAHVVRGSGNSLREALVAHDDAPTAPLLVIVSYDVARRQVDLLTEGEWDELICDEAAVLKTPGSKRTQALWDLRAQSRCAVALTGTPIERSLDDLGRILAWVRQDESMFHGKRLARRFDLTDITQAEKLWQHLGPCVFRRDRSEIADELPAISTETVVLEPSPAERALAEGARSHLRDLYEDLVTKIETAEALDPDDPALAEARRELLAARGAVLGGVTLARMAASDPAAVAASDSGAALLLDQAGLIAPALREGGTKRREIVALVDDLVAAGDAVLLFTDFASVATALADDLAARGVRVGTFLGGQSQRVRTKAQDDFQSGALDVLILTGAGREGLNLQRASVVVHYDMPWLATQVVQRVGRAARFGSTNDHVSVLVPLMAGTIEERVAAVLIPRATIALNALDAHRGINAADTDMGQAMGGLIEAVGDAEKAGQEGLFELAEMLLGDPEPVSA